MLRIDCFGQFRVARDGRLLSGAVTQPRRAVVLALLAHSGTRGISRDKIIAYLWPDLDQDRARRALSQAIYALRRELGSEEAVLGIQDLHLNPDEVACDVVEFQEAISAGEPERAAAAYGGPFLDGFYVPGAPELDRWIDEERTRLAHLYASVLERAAAGCESRGDHPAAVAWWRKLAAHDPVNGRVALRLMRALAAAGDRASAIRHASIYAALVDQELGIPADAAVLAYAEELRTAPADPPGAAAPGAAEPGAAAPGAAATPMEIAGEPAGPAAAAPQRRAPHRASRTTWLLTATAAAVAVLLFIMLGPRPGPVFDRDWVVVAPLENRTGDPSLDAVGLMVAEWVTQGLTRTGLVRVVDVQTVLAAAGAVEQAREANPIHALAERTGAGTVVSGSVYRQGDSLHFQMRITDARSGGLLGALDPVAVDASHPTAALEPLRQRLTGALAILLDDRLNNWSAVASQPPVFEAYQEFLSGMMAFGNDYPGSIAHFSRAAEIDSTYWQALLWAGQAYANIRGYREADSIFLILARNRARLAPYDQANLDYFYQGFVRGDWWGSYEGARRMVELAPRANHALYALGATATFINRAAEGVSVLERIDLDHGWGRDWAGRVIVLICRALHQLGDYERELEWGRRLREREPGYGWSRLAEARALAALGRSDELMRQVEQTVAFPPTDLAQTWEPFSPGSFLVEIGRDLSAHGHVDLADSLFERAVAWYRGRPPEEAAPRAHRRELARALYTAGRLDEARALYEALAAEEDADPAAVPERLAKIDRAGALAAIAAQQGRRAEADSLMARLRAEDPTYLFGRSTLWLARIAALQGSSDAAVALIRQAHREGMGRIYYIHSEPEFQSLHDYPPFREALRPQAAEPR